MLCCNGVGVSTFFFKYVIEHFRDRYQVIVWDYPGHGRSTAPPEPIEEANLTVERFADDAAAVLDHIGVNAPAILLGHSMGVQVILEILRRHPQRVRALIPMFGTFGRPLDTFMDSPYSRRIFDMLRRVAGWGGRSGSRLLRSLFDSPFAFQMGAAAGLVDRNHAGQADIDRYLEHLAHMDPRVFLRTVSQMADHDAADMLPYVSVPVLVIAGGRDVFTPMHRSLFMAEQLPNAELLLLEEGSHAAIIEHPDTINQRIDRFIAERVDRDQR